MSSKWNPSSSSREPLPAARGLKHNSSERLEAIPQWLIAEQKQMLRNAGKQLPPPKTLSAKKSRPSDDRKSKKISNNALSQDDDLIMVDLLDGAHVSTKPPAPALSTSAHHTQLTANSNSILSLPPVNSPSTSLPWSAMKAKAQDARRKGRGGASVGSFASICHSGKPVRHISHPKSNTEQLTTTVKENIYDEPDAITPVQLPVPPKHIHASRANASSDLSTNLHRKQGSANVPFSENAQNSQNHEIIHIPYPDAAGRKGHFRRSSFMTGSFWDEEFNANASVRSNERAKGHARKKNRRDRHHFNPGVWGWRMPAEEDAIMPNGAWIYLALIGFLTFSIAHSINFCSTFISRKIIARIASRAGKAIGARAEVFTLAGLRGLSLATSFILMLLIAPAYSAGSGIPEMKCVLSGVLLQKMLTWQTLVAKAIGLIFSLSSEISIGRLGPFIHISGITAALVSKIPWFTSLRKSARFQLQALSAAMAAGVGATFGAPIGGTMLSIEVMSTYYYIHWLPMALYCSIMGYYFIIAFVRPGTTAYFTSSVQVNVEIESVQKLLTYVLLGVLCGVLGAGLVEFTKAVFLLRRRFFKNATPIRTTLMVTVFAVMHTLISWQVGGSLMEGQKVAVTRLFNDGDGAQLWVTATWSPFPSEHINTFLRLLLATAVKFVLTGFSIVMPVPAGTFMPIFEIGAFFGRAFGELCNGIWFVNWVDVRATAIIGAAAVTAGTLHTTSVAVVMLELTREAIDVLPLTIGVIVSYGVSKQLCSDLFSELIKLRRLPFILGLRERYPSENRRFFEDAATVTAGSFMTKQFLFVTPQSTKREVLQMLRQGGKPWITCAFLSDKDRKGFWGTVSQQALWDSVNDDANRLKSKNSDEHAYGTFEHEPGGNDDLIPFLRDFNPSIGHEEVDMGAMQISVHTPYWRIITYFRMLSMNTMFVVEDGSTVGCVSRVQVIHYSIYREERAKRKREQEKEARLRKEREEELLLREFRRNPLGTRLASRLPMSEHGSHGRTRRHSKQNSANWRRG